MQIFLTTVMALLKVQLKNCYHKERTSYLILIGRVRSNCKKINNLSLVAFFILPPNIQVLKKRLSNRHKGQEKLIEQRMKKFNEEISHWNEYDYVVVNDDLQACYNKILNIIISEIKGVRQKQNLDKIEKLVEKLIK